jgi:hypothetical protein
MYGDTDGYSIFTEEINRDDYIKLQLFNFLDITFSHEQMGDTEGQISDFIDVEKFYFDLKTRSSIKPRYLEVEKALDSISDYIEEHYSDDLNYENLYKLYLNNDNFDIENYKLNSEES